MDKRKLNKVVRDVKKILVLAKSAHTHLEKNKISKAKKELKRVMGFDADEITRLHDEDEGMSHALLVECGIVLKNAKKALRDLDSSELFDKAKELVDEIVKLEGHEYIELEEEEHKENELYAWWHETVLKLIMYHGTSSLSLPKIKRYGLAPTMKPDYYEKFKRLHILYTRGGIGIPFNLGHSWGGAEFIDKGFFITGNYYKAKKHARPGPAIWHEFIQRDPTYKGAKWRFFEHAFFPANVRTGSGILWNLLLKKYGYPGAESPMKDLRSKLKSFFQINSKSAYKSIIDYAKNKYQIPKELICKLTTQEISEIIRIFEELWLTFKNSHGVILYISVLAPKLFVDDKGDNYVNNYKTFRKYFHVFLKGDYEFTKSFFLNQILHRDEMHVDRRIPQKYIVKIEEV